MTTLITRKKKVRKISLLFRGHKRRKTIPLIIPTRAFYWDEQLLKNHRRPWKQIKVKVLKLVVIACQILMRQVRWNKILIEKVLKSVVEKIIRRFRVSLVRGAARLSKAQGSLKCQLFPNYTQNQAPTLIQMNHLLIYGKNKKVVEKLVNQQSGAD